MFPSSLSYDCLLHLVYKWQDTIHLLPVKCLSLFIRWCAVVEKLVKI